MATITLVNRPLRYPGLRDAASCLWETLTETNDRGSAFEWPLGADVSLHVLGDFGSGGTVILQGSNEDSQPADAATTWAALNDIYGNALSFGAVGLEGVGPVCRWLRPLVTAGTGVDVDVYLLARRR